MDTRIPIEKRIKTFQKLKAKCGHDDDLLENQARTYEVYDLYLKDKLKTEAWQDEEIERDKMDPIIFKVLYGKKTPRAKQPPPTKFSFKDRLLKFVAEHDERLTIEEFKKIVSSWDNPRKPIIEWYKDYIKMMDNKPGAYVEYQKIQAALPNDVKEFIHKTGFKSPKKINALVQAKYPNVINKYQVRDEAVFPVNSFPLKYNKKHYQLHVASAPDTYIIDFLFVGKIVYLVAINVNTRKAYVEPTNLIVNNEDEFKIKIRKIDAKSSISFINAFKKMISEGMKPKHLRGDGEKAFASNQAIQYYTQIGAEFSSVPRLEIGSKAPFENTSSKTEPNHGSLAIIDRFIRTIRDMAYNIQIEQIQPKIMEMLVENYNNAPHTFLTKIIGYDVSPNMMNPEMEEYLIRKITQMNYNIVNAPGYKIPDGAHVSVYNEKDIMTKRRSITRPGIFTVKGWNNGMYSLEKNSANQLFMIPFDTLITRETERLRIPRWKIHW